MILTLCWVRWHRPTAHLAVPQQKQPLPHDTTAIAISTTTTTTTTTITTGSTATPASASYQQLLRRDGTLRDLVNLMNSDEVSTLFQTWASNPDTGRLLKIISPWIIVGDVATTLRLSPASVSSAVTPKLNCAQARYSAVFTGAPLKEGSRHWIIDFIAFGYDAEKLLIRLHETFDVVDIFVIYESPYTLMTARKPLYFEELRKQPRFLPFLTKIIHIIARENDMLYAVNMAKSAFERDEKTFGEVRGFRNVPLSSPLTFLTIPSPGRRFFRGAVSNEEYDSAVHGD